MANLALTKHTVVKSIFSYTYYVKIRTDEYDFNVFEKFMEDKGWLENKSEQMGGLHVFKKNENIRFILNTDIKTVLIDNKINLHYLKRILHKKTDLL